MKVAIVHDWLTGMRGRGEENVGAIHELPLQNTISALSDVMKQNSRERKYLRLKHFDYSINRAYFVTICTNKRNIYFEKYPDLQKVIHSFWNDLKIKFPVIEVDEFVVMPNHVHGIIFIMGGNDVMGVGAIPRFRRDVPHESPIHLPTSKKRRNMLLPKVVGYFKMNTAKHINQILRRSGQPFWQRNYYEHVIRHEEELRRIREYIQNNPKKWELDRDNPESKNFNLNHDSYWSEVYCRGNSPPMAGCST